MGSSAPLGTKNLFNTPGASLPGYIREIARELMKKGKTKSEAIQMAIGVCKRWAAEGKPKAVEAIRQWEAAKAKAHATPNKADLSNPSEDAEKGGHCMIALEVPDGTIAGKDGLHLTMAYLGADVSDREFAGAVSRALSAAQENGPITGSVGGLGVFPPKDGQVPVWATVDAPAIARLHDQVIRRYGRSDGGEEHGFTPHITLDWIKEGGKLPAPLPKTPVTFTHLIVKRGDQQFRFALGGEYREWSNPLAVSGRQVLLAQAPEPKEKKKPPEKSTEPAQGQRYKHGWIPVDENGKQTGPARPPAWLKAAKAKHAAAGGRTAEQIQAEKAQAEFKGRAEKAAAPAKKAKAEAEQKAKKDAADTKRTAAKTAAAKKRAAADTERKTKAADRASEKKTKDRQKQINAAYRQALTDRKAGRELSEQQRRVVAHVEAQQKKEQARLRKVDVKGADGSTVAKKSVMPAKKAAGAVTTAVKKVPPVKVKSYTTGLQNRNKSRRRGGVATLSNPFAPWDQGGISNAEVLEFSAMHPKGQLAFRYKHGWILINPAIPSRGHLGGGLARQHGHKSGSVTHGHFEPSGNGKGKKFVPERTGGKTAAQKVAELKQKSGVNDKSKYTTAAVQKDSGNALKPSIPSAEKVSSVSKDANAASVKANTSKSLMDAQVAAKKHADAYVQAKKGGNAQLAESHKANAQAWAKKAQQIKQAESASKKAKAEYEAEQKAKAAADAEAAKKAEKVALARKTALELYTTGHEDNNAAMMQVIKAQALAKPDEFGNLKLSDFDAIDKKFADAKKAKEDAEYKEKANAALKMSTDAFNLGDDADNFDTPSKHQKAAAAHAKAEEALKAVGMVNAAKGHAQQFEHHTNAKAKLLEPAPAPTAPKAAPKTSTGPGEGNQSTAMAIQDVVADLPLEVNGKAAEWETYLSAAVDFKEDQSFANLKKATAAHKVLVAKGVTSDQIESANIAIFDKLNKKKPAAKKTVAQKKAAEATPPAKKAAVAPAAPVPVPVIDLPGPGMYANGNAIIQGKKKADAMPEGPKKDAQLEAVSNAMQKFENIHGQKFDINAVEIASTDTFVPGHSGDLKSHPAYADAVDAGFTPVNIGESANGDWKPSDVPGLTSHGGAYHYSGGSYSEINAQLRKYKAPTGGSNDAAIAQMDKEFAAVPPLTQGIVTTRRMSDKGPFPEIPPPMEPGVTYQDHGYSSTSKETGMWSGSVVMQIRIPEGARVLDLNHTTGSQHSSEQEILLNRGSKYRVVSDAKVAGERKIVVELVI